MGYHAYARKPEHATQLDEARFDMPSNAQVTFAHEARFGSVFDEASMPVKVEAASRPGMVFAATTPTALSPEADLQENAPRLERLMVPKGPPKDFGLN
ncbi:MAG: hypothetical protein EB059_01620 [Alphaproteobacteria bacterium]|nr:hypothetical protein [Alphaproteobacteria bacterium]